MQSIVDKLYDFQNEGIDFLLKHKTVLLGDDMGLGKSVQALMASHLPLLIVCKKSLMLKWLSEIEKWMPDWLDLVVICDDKTWGAKQDKLGGRPHIVIVNYAMFSHKKLGPKITNRTWATAIIDEAHHFKGRKALRTKQAFKLKAGRKYLLTATPITNSPEDLWALLRILKGYKEYPSFWGWVNEFCKVETRYFSNWPTNVITGWRYPDDVKRELSPYYIRRTKEEVMQQLPKITWVDIPCELSEHERDVYDMAESKLLLSTKNGYEIIPSKLTSLIRLRQLLTSPQTFGLSDVSTKQEALIDLVNSVLETEDRIVIYTWFKDAAYNVSDMLYKHDILCDTITGDTAKDVAWSKINLFQSNNTNKHVLIGTIKTLNEGLDLHRARVCIFLERSYVPTDNYQAANRLHRIGQDRPVIVYTLSAVNTIDTSLKNVLDRKDKMINEVWVSSKVLEDRQSLLTQR